MASKTPWDFGFEDGQSGRVTRLRKDPRAAGALAYAAGFTFGACGRYAEQSKTPPGGFPKGWGHRFCREAWTE